MAQRKHREQWTVTLATYVHPVIGALAVADIDTALVLKVLQPIWETKTETAVRVRGRIEPFSTGPRCAAIGRARTRRAGAGISTNCCRPRPRLRQIEHHPALAYAELPGFMTELPCGMTWRPALSSSPVLTASRTGEVIGAKWDEIDLAAKVWTVPAGRMKAGREHRVPLSDRALAILQSLPREAGNRLRLHRPSKERRLSGMAMLQMLREMRPGR